MSIVVYEMLDSMSGSVSNDLEQGETREVRRSYVIGQCEGFNDAVTQIEQYAPQYVESDGAGIYWRRTRLEVNGIGNKYFQVTATYATLVPKGDGGGGPPGTDSVPGSLAWDTTGHTEHITQSLSTLRFPAAKAPDFEGAINVSGNTVNGLDVVRPCLRYSETWIFPASVAISPAFLGAVYQRTGSVNRAQFRAFQPGEALFMGARASWQGDLPYVAVTFEFEARPNGDWYSQGFGQTIPKEGWQYIWLLYETGVNNDRLIQRPIYAYKETVYEKQDWSGLLIGGAIGAAQRGAGAGAPNVGGNGFN
jgi:hypothetical protein